MKPNQTTEPNSSRRTVLISRLRSRKTKSVSEILQEAAELDAAASELRVQSRERRQQFETLMAQGLSGIEASRLLLAKPPTPAPPPVAPKAEVRPVTPTPTAVPTAITRAIEGKVAAALDSAILIQAGQAAFGRIQIKSITDLEKKLWQKCLHGAPGSISAEVAAGRKWVAWNLKGREQIAASFERRIYELEIERLSAAKPTTTKPNTWITPRR